MGWGTESHGMLYKPISGSLAASKIKDAKKSLEYLRTLMAPSQISEAEGLIQEWKVKHKAIE
jgi:hypothetical protein